MHQRSKKVRLVTLFAALAVMAAMLPAMIVSAAQEHNLGAFDEMEADGFGWWHRWNAGESEGTVSAPMEVMRAATHLVVEFNYFPEEEGNVSLIVMGDGNDWRWTQEQVWGSGEGLTMEIELASVFPGNLWQTLVADEAMMFALGHHNLYVDSMIDRAFLRHTGATAGPVATPAPTPPPPPPPGQQVLELTINSETYRLNGAPGTLDATPFLSAENRTMVPFRFIGQAMGATVTHTDANPAAGTPLIAHFTLGDIRLDLPQGETLFIDGVNMGTPANVGGRLFVPVAYVSVKMGANVDWIQATRTVVVTFGGTAAQQPPVVPQPTPVPPQPTPVPPQPTPAPQETPQPTPVPPQPTPAPQAPTGTGDVDWNFADTLYYWGVGASPGLELGALEGLVGAGYGDGRVNFEVIEQGGALALRAFGRNRPWTGLDIDFASISSVNLNANSYTLTVTGIVPGGSGNVMTMNEPLTGPNDWENEFPTMQRNVNGEAFTMTLSGISEAFFQGLPASNREDGGAARIIRIRCNGAYPAVATSEFVITNITIE